MTELAVGKDSESADINPFVAPEGFDIMGLVESIKEGMRHEMAAAVADVERRLAQAREIEQAIAIGTPRRSVHTEDLNVGFAMIDGYTLTANSPGAGSIAWSSLHVVLLGVDYTITDGNTALKYAWFVKPGSGTSATLQVSNTMPTLGPQDALIFINNSGTPISVLESSVVYAVGPGVIGNAQLDTATQQTLANLQASDIALQARVDGVITSYYQNAAPWPAGAPSAPASGGGGGDVNMGDIWYDADDGGAFRWTGASGTPANTWQRIADTDTSAIAAKVNTKVSTYLAVAATPPTAPAGGFTIGDFWMVTDQGNLLRRWNGTVWSDVQLGDGAISGVSGAKIGTGISASNVTTGTLTGTLVGTGVSATNVTTGTLSGGLVGTGINASNVSTGTLAGARVGTGVDATMITAGTLSGALVGTGVSATNVTTGTLAGARVGTGVDASMVTTGTLAGARVGTGVSATMITTGTLTGSLVGTGVSASNVTTGTLTGSLVGAGVAPSALTGAGTVPLNGIPTISPAKLNTAFHMLY